MERTGEDIAGTEREIGATVASTVDRVHEEGRRIGETARTSALRAAEERKSQAAEFVQDMSSAIEKGSAELRQRGREQSAAYVDIAAGELARFGERLQGREVGELLNEVERFARRRPGLLFGAALLAGFGMVRFAMSSRERVRQEAGSAGESTSYYQAGGGR